MLRTDRSVGALGRRGLLELAAALVVCCMTSRVGWADPTSDDVASNVTQIAASDAPQPRRPIRQELSGEEGARYMSLPPGFRVQLAASEPQIRQPVAMAFDERGRLWVAEALAYPVRGAEGEGRDRIVILEDVDKDGTLEHRKVFAENLNLVSGLEIGFGGAWVGAAPYLLFFPDRNADDCPDGPPETLLDGFGVDDTHETLNSFIWGPDGWLYGCHGVFSHARVAAPGTPDAERVPLNAGVWRYHPQRRQFEPFAHGTSNPWGVDFDDHGQAFITACVIPHLYHIAQGGRYQRQAGAHFAPYTFDDIKTIADHVHYAGDIRDHAWWGQSIIDLPSSVLDAGGGHAHCGAMIYLADNWPAAYRGSIYMHNVHGNRVNCDGLEARGSGFVGRHRRDLLLANDRWFRGVALKYGPDGAVYVIDWYDAQACHRTNPETWDRGNGRIYRVFYGECPSVKPDLGRLGDDELVELQRHANEWYVRMSRRLLQERGSIGAAARSRLDALAGAAEPARIQLRALWTLHALGALDEGALVDRLASPHAYVRAWAVQLALESRRPSVLLLDRLAELAQREQAPQTTLYLASALQRLDVGERRALAEALLERFADADDPNVPLMLWYGIEPLIGAEPAWGLQAVGAARLPLLREFALRRLASDRRSLPLVLDWLDAQREPAAQKTGLQQMVAALTDQADLASPPTWPRTSERLLAAGDPDVCDLVDRAAVLLNDAQVLPRLRGILADPSAPDNRRIAAIEGLRRSADPETLPALEQALDTQTLASHGIRALASWSDEAIPEMLLARYANWGAAEKNDALQTLASRAPFAAALLDAVESQQIARGDLLAHHVRQLRNLGNPSIDARVAQIWGPPRATPEAKRALIDRLRPQLAPEALASANAEVGKSLFVKHCASCHTLFGEGGKIGPDLTGSNRTNAEYLLENLVDPNALVGKEYLATVVQTDDGRTLTGIVVQENESALALQTATEKIVVPKSAVEARTLADVSLMPDGLVDSLQGTDLRDLAAYLRGTPGPLAPARP